MRAVRPLGMGRLFATLSASALPQNEQASPLLPSSSSSIRWASTTQRSQMKTSGPAISFSASD